ncbi:hypothetical protein K435DRAFT_783745 [Dendrothele bispora CBS 962.96]|uniref:BTB domain-containing protein n=1 Tax=Dendrothele bispora (strain CBS 962.96) TaxID=1314807 RepID=A0A4S8L7W0_DENBC|nr:hypothetical protein K435DRAFT_783745 [Dendrothele bispora CBS 962.96]
MDRTRTELIRPPEIPVSADSTSHQQQQSIIHSTDVWFDDGTLIIDAEGVYFRVYKGILSANSPVFNDMFDIPQPIEGTDTYEGCPVVKLYDSATEMMHFLKALHFASYYDTTKPTKFALVSAVLRLSTKYQVDFLRQRAFRQLSALYPTTLSEWDKRENVTTIETFEARPFAVFLLAKETNASTLLPTALYLCADSQEIDYILDGLHSYDGQHIELDWPDKRACLRARESLSLDLRSRVFAFLTGRLPLSSCRTEQRCNSMRLRWLQSVESSLGSGIFSVQFPWPQFRSGVCEYCFTASQSHYRDERANLWRELPGKFGLPSWDVLTRDVADLL